MKQISAYIAPAGFEDDLANELELAGLTVCERMGRLFVVEGGGSAQIAWAQDVWHDCQELTVSSIADAAKQLKKHGGRWTLFSQGLHRRASLIQAQLPKVKATPLEFLRAPSVSGGGSWSLLEANRLIFSKQTLSLCANGEANFIEDKRAPSRAYLKLWELFTLHGIRPKRGERCLDLGASPGGWTWVLANLGCQVVAIDRSPLAPALMRNGNVEFIQRNALTLKPGDLAPVDWLFSDVICYPQDLFKMVETWLAVEPKDGGCRGFVCTLKFKGPTDHQIAKRFAGVAGSHLKHLSVNKHELTWWLVRKAKSG